MRGSMLEPGDRVMFSARFLKSIQAHELGQHVGTVREVYQAGSALVCRVAWDNTGTTGSVLHPNLVLAKRVHLEAH